MKNSDYIVQERAPEFDRATLHKKLFQVNMRIYNSSSQYKSIIKNVVDYMSWILDQTWEDSDPATSIAGANIGVPWNIVVLWDKQSKRILLNPEIVEHSADKVTIWTNNSSLKLKMKISIQRWAWVTIRYYGLDGNLYFDEKIDRTRGGLSIQHEIDSNNGLLITDRQAMQYPTYEGFD